MKKIETLVTDINKWLEKNVHTFSESNLDTFANNIKEMLKNRFSDYEWTPKLTLSNLGTPCKRKLWYTINKKEKREPLSPSAVLKFLYGDLIEELILLFAAEAGHKVEGVQDYAEIEGVKGRRDAVIDGSLVDVKSTNDRGMVKFKKGLSAATDSFGYLTQLDTYLHASADDPLVTDKDYAYFLAVDKTLGNIHLDKHRKRRVNYSKKVAEARKLMDLPEPPPRHYEDKTDGKSGNRKLGTECKYCPFKEECWPGLRTFIYSNGPTYLTKVNRLPKVPEKKNAS